MCPFSPRSVLHSQIADDSLTSEVYSSASTRKQGSEKGLLTVIFYDFDEEVLVWEG